MSEPFEDFRFRDLHPNVRVGTASDRYAGWLGQIYSAGRYEGRIRRRTKRLGRKSFTEEVLPVDSVTEYFEHFSILEIDYTFYHPLLEPDGTPSSSHRVLGSTAAHLRDGDRVLLKVPQAICAQKIRRGGTHVPNASYLDAALFTRRFYEPAIAILGPHLAGFIFEQEYQRKDERIPVGEIASRLDAFLGEIPGDDRYHLELRTESYLDRTLFEVLARHGVGQVLSHWTWLPPLVRQFEASGGRFLNRGGSCVLRLMTPIGVRYAEAYARAHPFDRLVEGMLQPRMVAETVSLLRAGVAKGGTMNLVINNRSGGNAPLIARKIATEFLRP